MTICGYVGLALVSGLERSSPMRGEQNTGEVARLDGGRLRKDICMILLGWLGGERAAKLICYKLMESYQ
jgi:hypothetical protein